MLKFIGGLKLYLSKLGLYQTGGIKNKENFIPSQAARTKSTKTDAGSQTLSI